jgi:tetrahydrodipicolinate N-succinyltransferase
MFDIAIGATYSVGGGVVVMGTVNGSLNVPVRYALLKSPKP